MDRIRLLGPDQFEALHVGIEEIATSHLAKVQDRSHISVRAVDVLIDKHLVIVPEYGVVQRGSM